MPAQAKRDVGAGACVAKGGGNAYSEDSGVVRLRGARGIVIHQTYWSTAEM